MPAFAGMTGVVNSSERLPVVIPAQAGIQNLSISRRQTPEFTLSNYSQSGSLGFPHSRILYSAHASASTRLGWAGPSPGGNLSGQAQEIRR